MAWCLLNFDLPGHLRPLGVGARCTSMATGVQPPTALTFRRLVDEEDHDGNADTTGDPLAQDNHRLPPHLQGPTGG